MFGVKLFIKILYFQIYRILGNIRLEISRKEDPDLMSLILISSHVDISCCDGTVAIWSYCQLCRWQKEYHVTTNGELKSTWTTLIIAKILIDHCKVIMNYLRPCTWVKDLRLIELRYRRISGTIKWHQLVEDSSSPLDGWYKIC